MKTMVHELRDNEEVTTFFGLGSMRMKTSRNRREFLDLDLHDRSGAVKGYVWDDPLGVSLAVREKSYVKVKGRVRTHRGNTIINVEQIRTALQEEVDLEDFFEVVPGGTAFWYDRLVEKTELIEDVHCRRLIRSFLNDERFAGSFSSCPGAVEVHHNYMGGLVEHTCNVMEIVSHIADMNGALIDRDLALTGAFLHDIGKTREIRWEVARDFTTEGRLMGHITIGVDMIRKRMGRLEGFPDDLKQALVHIVLSHHGEPEFGSPVRPATPEALLIHLADLADSKLNHMACHLKYVDPDREWSCYDRYLRTGVHMRKYRKELREGLACGR